MPSMFGGDQCGKDYAPHMWIGDHFVGSKITCQYRGKNYEVGLAKAGPIAQRIIKRGYGQILVGSKVPQQLADAARAEKERRTAEIESVKSAFRDAGATVE